jgi:hypothetical protein
MLQNDVCVFIETQAYMGIHAQNLTKTEFRRLETLTTQTLAMQQLSLVKMMMEIMILALDYACNNSLELESRVKFLGFLGF